MSSASNDLLVRPAMQEAAAYLRAMEGAVLVVCLSPRVCAELKEHLADLALLASLKVRLVVVFSPIADEPQLLPSSMDEANLKAWMQAVYETQAELIGALNHALPGVRPHLVVSNFVSARPRGVRNGQHGGSIGTVRHLDIAALQLLLDAGCTVLVPPSAPSLLGHYYALDAMSLAAQLAVELGARKLILFTPGIDQLQDLPHDEPVGVEELLQLADKHEAKQPYLCHSLLAAAEAAKGNVERVHLLDPDKDGVLLAELYTRQGAGALIVRSHPEPMHTARPEDAPGLLQILAPLEQDGTLIARSHERLEHDIEQFLVLQLEERIIGCCALIAHGDTMELAALAVEPRYRRAGRASLLLGRAEKVAVARGMERLMVFTTVAEDWFLERGFVRGKVSDLPAEQAALYNYHRHSVILIKPLKRAQS